MTVWVFGDSYVEDNQQEYQWFRQLSKLMDEPVETRGQSGWSNDFITNQLYLHCVNGDIKQDDFVIQIQTQYSRTWFFEDRPQLSNFVHHNDPTEIGMTRDEKRATDAWLKHLYNPKGLIWQSYANSMATVGVTSHYAGCKCLTIPAFHNVLEPYNPWIGVQGTLTECISYLEYADKKEYYAALEQPGGDPRINHMNPHNHGVLAQKIADSVLTTGEIDLFNGFDTRKPTQDDFETPQDYERYLNENSD